MSQDKKYFLYTGTEQTGPFTIDELKVQNIQRSTSVWYEGLPEWTTASAIPDLHVLFTAQPPPVQPPPVKPAATSQKPVKNSSRQKLVVGIMVIGILIVVALMINNNPNALPGMRVELNTPKPVVITSRADGDKSGLFNARTTVYATVQNQGGDGTIYVTFYITQGKKKVDKSKSVFLTSNQSEDLEMTFEEVTYFGGDITYSVEARAQ